MSDAATTSTEGTTSGETTSGETLPAPESSAGPRSVGNATFWRHVDIAIGLLSASPAARQTRAWELEAQGVIDKLSACEEWAIAPR